ncbi:ABC transporter permease [Pseudogracilibacillus auburnensis]|uniref:Peptide/nickel transport system permease protein n=1 Tax=Pseudogracilibacillus auburnensis TaxID=1494959 RepID=A0A2V3VYI9_9BACI|nr:ABC transporter permease [Pseudogracilibacillus auburnensis]MBO1001753.1 ABC transporter permease [Pseudogracilibacillus auburnensis]PXW85984.1 peptide/nickel transport system permease protein [Pseudogracilibacillus auburnensis]
MYIFIIRRILSIIPVLFGITVFIFLIMHVIPGDITSILLGTEATPELKEQLKEKLGLNLPLYQQYWNWLLGVLVGDFGESLRTGAPILPEILNRFTLTFELTIFASIIAWVIAIPLGIIAGIHRNTKTDIGLRIVSLMGVSVPNFALATLLILVLSLQFNYFTPVDYVGFFENPLKNMERLFLPALVLGTAMAGSIMRMTRSSILEVLRQDFVRTARAKGIKERAVIFRHAFRNAMIPILTVIGMQIGFLLGGTVIVEQIFSLPGLGQYVLTGITQRDIPVVQGSILFIAVMFVTINLIVDLLYGYLNPRISYK